MRLHLQVSKQERLLLPTHIADGKLPLAIGGLERAIATPEALAKLLLRHRCSKLCHCKRRLGLCCEVVTCLLCVAHEQPLASSSYLCVLGQLSCISHMQD